MPTASYRNQRGAYLLEVLIAVLIFALGVLGIVGLQAASLRATSDTQLRAEAVMAANQLVGQMWADNVSNLPSYDNSVGGAGYANFAAQLKTVQAGAWVVDPTVTVDGAGCGAAPSQTSHTVDVKISWQSPTGIHNYETCAVIGQNV